MNNDAMISQAEERVAAERDRAIADATAVVSADGAEICIDCGVTIPDDRRLAAPWAKRCFECQGFFEAERLAR